MSEKDESLGEHLALCARSSLCDVITRPSLMDLLKKEDLDGFRSALEEATEEQIDCKYEPQSYTCLEYASERGLYDFVTLLLEHGANPEKYNVTRYGNAIHFAAKKGQASILQCFLPRVLDLNRINNRGRTALHLVVESGVANFKKSVDNSNVLRCLNLLLDVDRVDIDVRDRSGATAVHLAVRGGWWTGVHEMLKYGPDMDAEVDGATTRHLLEDGCPDLLDFVKPKDAEKSGWRFLKHRMFEALYKENEESFVDMVPEASDLNADDGTFTFLQYACEHGYYDCVNALLTKGADPNHMSQGNNNPPISIAAGHGYHKILHRLSSCDKIGLHATSGNLKRTVLHNVALRESKRSNNEQDFDMCMTEVLLDPPDINAQDMMGNTALHYAARNGNRKAILSLLRKGSSLSIKNKQHEPPVAIIAPDILKEFLDECIKFDRDPVSDQFQVTLQYGFLAPMGNSDADTERQEDNTDDMPETEPLWYLWQSRKHQHLLKHPIISSFLYLKFQRIRIFYYANLLIHTAFVILLSYYLSQTFGQSEEVSPYVTHSITALLVCLILRESIQVAVSIKRYLISFENLCEVLLIVMTCLVLYSSIDSYMKHHLAPLLILLAWSELLFILGQHPILCTYMTMFATVSINYVAFLATFSSLICAFALSFGLAFHKCDDDADCEDFSYFPTSVLRTCVMMIGEFEFGSLPFEALPGTSQVVFFLFLFLIVMVLLNLLNGLAVSDTQAIRERAELVGYGSRLQLISYIECTLLGDPLHFFSKWGPFQWMRRLPDCTLYSLCHRTPNLRRFLRVLTFGKRALLFPKLPKRELQVTFADAIKVYPECFHLDESIAGAAKAVVLERIRVAKDDEDSVNINERIRMLEDQMKRVCNSLDAMVRVLKVPSSE